ncbi:hypothetical protein [Cupriavidus pauculus]|uniref:Uncharacterized protein n=1 Tax=Cupriavidus pauculus TaxID=82633 RepID=A0A2N5C3K6_9BURK|nr:hypothetical protein [Cupriavidus pauculus]PLP96788.1 hypothetical protein CYJ10_30895 [Cupriavidus pauculus]
MLIFDEAAEILRKVEAHLLGVDALPFRLAAKIQWIVHLPFPFLSIGVRERRAVAVRWSLLSAAFLLIGQIFIAWVGIARTEWANYVSISCMLAPILLIAFALPSTYGASGVTSDDVVLVRRHLQERGFSKEFDVELLKKCIKQFEDRVRVRIVGLKWIVGLLWASFLYFWSKAIEASAMTVLRSVGLAVGLFFAVLVGYLLVWGYESAVNRLFNSLAFGCDELCRELKNRAPVLRCIDADCSERT